MFEWDDSSAIRRHLKVDSIQQSLYKGQHDLKGTLDCHPMTGDRH